MSSPHRVVLVATLGVAALLFAGCPAQPPPHDFVTPSTSDTQRLPADSVEAATVDQEQFDKIEQQSLETARIARENEIAFFAKQSKDVFVLETQNAINDGDYRILKLKQKATRLEGDERRLIDETIDELEAAVQRVVDELEKVIRADALEWEELRDEVDQALFDLESIREPAGT
jgi:hypothetical protein